MTERKWFASTDPQAMLAWRRAHGSIGAWEKRLWVKACRAAYDFPEPAHGWCDNLDDPRPSTLANVVGAWANGYALLKVSWQVRCDILRDIVPYHPCRVTGPNNTNRDAWQDITRYPIIDSSVKAWEPPWAPYGSWNNGLIYDLAKSIAERQAFGEMGILADAFEESRLCNDVFLDHLRQPGQHWPGCWALRLICELGEQK